MKLGFPQRCRPGWRVRNRLLCFDFGGTADATDSGADDRRHAGALLITKLPILRGDARLFRGEHGWGDFLHESRLDLAQLCGSLFLLLAGAGAWSLDAYLTRNAHRAAQ